MRVGLHSRTRCSHDVTVVASFQHIIIMTFEPCTQKSRQVKGHTWNYCVQREEPGNEAKSDLCIDTIVLCDPSLVPRISLLLLRGRKESLVTRPV